MTPGITVQARNAIGSQFRVFHSQRSASAIFILAVDSLEQRTYPDTAIWRGSHAPDLKYLFAFGITQGIFDESSPTIPLQHTASKCPRPEAPMGIGCRAGD